jgi:hypothetical protein
MNEQQWLSCADPIPMLEFLGDKASDRKLRLFACACCRRTWHLLTDERSRNAIEASERYADRRITQRQLMAACGAAQKVALKVLNTDGSGAAVVWAVQAAHEVAKSAQTIPSRAQLMTELPGGIVNRAICCAKALPVPRLDERKQLAVLLRDVFGNPFRHVWLNPAWLACNDGAIPKLAQAIYEERAFDRLPILADALEEAGCTDTDLVDHCRNGGEHILGCWAVDAILAKS